MGAIKIKVIDYIGDYYILFGDGKSWWNLVFIRPGGQFGHRYGPMATRHIVQSSLKVQDGVSLACSFPPSDSKTALAQCQAVS